MADIALYDAYGRPVQKNILAQEVARPSLAGIRSLWNYSYVTGGLTPQKLATLLKAAAEGDADAYLTLAEEMEEKDLHYASVLGTRKRAVARLPIVVESASDDPRDIAMADEVRTLLKSRRTGTKGMIEECLDALGKGYSAVEICWDKSINPWRPGRYKWRDPRFFQFDRETLSELRLRDEADLMNGIPLPAYKFIIHTPRLKCGIPIRGGLARLAAWSYCFKNFAVKDWVAFCEVFGMPLRLGKYRPGESEDNISILKSAVANLGSDAAAVIPEGMMIEFIDGAKGTGGESLFERIADWFDKQISKGILGQTMTADDGSSQSQATVHNEVREDIRDADAEQLAETLERDLVIPYIDLNYGPQANYPTVYLREADQADIPLMAEALAKLVPLGLRVEVSEVRDKMGFSDPAKDAECLQLVTTTTMPTDPLAIGGKPSLNSFMAEAKRYFAINSELPAVKLNPAQQSIENLKLAAIDPAAAAMDGMLRQVVDIIQGATSFDEALAHLSAAYDAMDETALAELLAQAMFSAQVVGRIDASPPSGAKSDR